MITEVVDHAERVLRHAPGYSMPAGALHRTVAREAGIRIPLRHFMAELRARPDRFTVIAPPPLEDPATWRAEESAAYADALRTALAMTGPFVILAGNDSADRTMMQPADAVFPPSAEPCAIEALQEGLAEVLRTAGADAGLRGSLAGAIAEIQAACSALRSTP
jgi:hypothetical protein